MPEDAECGWQAHAEVQLADNARVRIADVRDLVMWVLADGSNPSWAFIKVISSSPQHHVLSCHVASLKDKAACTHTEVIALDGPIIAHVWSGE